MKISAHTLVRNEERYIWYAATSVIEYVDKMVLWDMNSTDNTFKILKHIKEKYPQKVELRQTGTEDVQQFTKLRQQMLDEEKNDWVIIVDGDEVWWDEKIEELTGLIHKSGNKLDSVVSRYTNIVGDIYHYQDEKASHYSIDNIVGSITIRAMNRNIDGLHYAKPHGTQGIFDGNDVLIQELDPKRRAHIDEVSYLHFTHMQRGGKNTDNLVSKRKAKYKHELGIPFPYDYFYPEVFFRSRPSIVSSVWDKRSLEYTAQAAIETFPKKLRRRFLQLPEGY